MCFGRNFALLSAEVTDGILGVEHDSNRELIGQGLGNIVSSLVGGIPVSGAVARSGVNVHSGGRTRLSSILHSIFLALMILVFAPIVRRIPLASLAAILMVASVRTMDWESLKLIPKARWSYAVIMVITTILTVVKNLTVAVAVGVALSGINVLINLASLPGIKTGNDKKSPYIDTYVHPDIEVISLHGPLFFVGVENIRQKVKEVFEKSVLILDFTDVNVIDETAALALGDFYLRLKKEGKTLYIGGLSKKCMRVFIKLKVVDRLGKNRVCKSLRVAVKRALKETDQLCGVYETVHHSTSFA